MQFIEDDALERTEQEGCVGTCQKERKLLRRRQQNIGRIAPLPLALGRGRVASACFEPHRQSHFLHRNFQISRNVDCECLQRGYVKRMEPLRTHERAPARFQIAWQHATFTQLDQCRQKARERLAAARWRDQQHRTARFRLRQQFELMRARLPGAAREPARENVRQQR